MRMHSLEVAPEEAKAGARGRCYLQAAQKPAESEIRTQFLTREQVVKILEFLHQDDE